MGVRQKIRARFACFKCGKIKITCDREKAFCAKKPAIADLRKPSAAERIRQRTAIGLHRARMVDGPVALTATGLIIPCEGTNALQQRGLARAVLANDDGDGFFELEFEASSEQ